jgi:hypothetical protein
MGGSAACNRSKIVASCGAGRQRSVSDSTRTSSSLALTVLINLLPPAAPAQDSELEQVFVTGSRIARPDFDSASPIVSVTQELFERVGSGTVETAINTLPSSSRLIAAPLISTVGRPTCHCAALAPRRRWCCSTGNG